MIKLFDGFLNNHPELKRFLKDKISITALIVLIVLYAAILFADFFCSI